MKFNAIKRQTQIEIKNFEQAIKDLETKLSDLENIYVLNEDFHETQRLALLDLISRNKVELAILNYELLAIKIVQTKLIKAKLLELGFFGSRITKCDKLTIDYIANCNYIGFSFNQL